MRWRYKFDVEHYNEMFDEQNGKCPICNRHQNELEKPLRIDHNHSTSVVRGLLCDNCNTAIGLLHEDKETFIKAVKYLKGTL